MVSTLEISAMYENVNICMELTLKMANNILSRVEVFVFIVFLAQSHYKHLATQHLNI